MIYKGISEISHALGLSYSSTQLLLQLGHIDGYKVLRGKQRLWQVHGSEIQRILDLRADPPTYDETTLGKEFVERYGYSYPRFKFDEFDVYEVPEDDPTAEPVLVAGSDVELLPGEATPHTLTQDGIASIEDWCDFLNEKRFAVLNAGPLILPRREMDKWARRVRRLMPPKKLGKQKPSWTKWKRL